MFFAVFFFFKYLQFLFLQSSVHKSKYTETTPSTVCFSNPRWRAHRLQGRLHSTQPVTETALPVRTSNPKDHRSLLLRSPITGKLLPTNCQLPMKSMMQSLALVKRDQLPLLPSGNYLYPMLTPTLQDTGVVKNTNKTPRPLG